MPVNRVKSLACRTLLTIARQRKGLDDACCRVVFEHLDTSAVLQTALHRLLATYRLSELQFGVLVVLFNFDPEPVTSADLADHTAVSRSAITDAIDQLEKLNFAVRTRDTRDRRVIHVQLTASGCVLVDKALTHYLQVIGKIGRYIKSSDQTRLLGGYALLKEGAATFLT